ncbi:hypothetical protein OSTOST_16018 [Ostertagia ostertagi]
MSIVNTSSHRPLHPVADCRNVLRCNCSSFPFIHRSGQWFQSESIRWRLRPDSGIFSGCGSSSNMFRAEYSTLVGGATYGETLKNSFRSLPSTWTSKPPTELHGSRQTLEDTNTMPHSKT